MHLKPALHPVKLDGRFDLKSVSTLHLYTSKEQARYPPESSSSDPEPAVPTPVDDHGRFPTPSAA